MKVTLDVDIVMDLVVDEDADLSWLEQDCFNDVDAYGRDRIASYGDEWHMIGVRAVAVGPNGQRVATSAGLWGVESDSGDDYLASIFADEALDLLYQLGIGNNNAERLALLKEAGIVR